MIAPNFLPRTLRGVGGVRLYNIPGVVYPKEMLEAPKERRQKSGKPYTTVPAWGITTRAAAQMLDCTLAAARLTMQRHKVTYRLVEEPRNVPRLYWNRAQVEKIVESRLPLVKKIPAKMMSSEEAVRLLGVCRSSLYRYARKGRIREYQVRLMTDAGTRKVSLFLKADVRRLAANLNAIREFERQAEALRAALRTSPPSSDE